jgi:hypothetical protein
MRNFVVAADAVDASPAQSATADAAIVSFFKIFFMVSSQITNIKVYKNQFWSDKTSEYNFMRQYNPNHISEGFPQ